MSISRSHSTALYEQIAAQLRQEIARGLYTVGPLPSETDLVARFAVSRVTVRLALAQLAAEGLIERRQGKGTYATGGRLQHGLDTLRGFHDALVLQGLAAQQQLLEMELRPIPTALGTAMKTRSKTTLFVSRLHRVDKEPLALASTYLPPAARAIPREQASKHSSYSILSDILGWPIERAELRIRVQPADEQAVRHLHVRPGASLLVMERTSYLADGRACEHTVFQIRPERYELLMNSPAGIKAPE